MFDENAFRMPSHCLKMYTHFLKLATWHILYADAERNPSIFYTESGDVGTYKF